MVDSGEVVGAGEQSTVNPLELKNDSAVSSANKKLLPPVGYDPSISSTLQVETHFTQAEEQKPEAGAQNM